MRDGEWLGEKVMLDGFFSARKRREKQQEIKIFKDEQLIETMNNLFFFFGSVGH